MSEEYDLISWVIRIFIGAAFNIVFIAGWINLYWSSGQIVDGTINFSATPLSTIALIWILGIILVLSPLLASLALSKKQPLRIVPPFYVAVVTFGFIIAIWGITSSSNFILSVLVGGMFAVVGLIEDVAATTILGIASDRANIYFEQLTVYADIDDVKARLTVPEIKDGLFLSDKIDGDSEKGYTFKTTHENYLFSHKITLTKSKEEAATTILKIVYFDVGKYNLTSSPAFIEEATKISLYLKEILGNRKPNIMFARDVGFTNEAQDSLIDCIIDDNRGYYVKSKRFTKLDRFRIGAIFLIAVIAIILFAVEQTTYGALIAVLDALITVSQIPNLLKKQS
jgi:hypothetical protein